MAKPNAWSHYLASSGQKSKIGARGRLPFANYKACFDLLAPVASELENCRQ
jgi:hypothetical protein